MFVLQNEINSYPFTENSTFILNETGYTLPKDLFSDMCAYPRCDNNAPFHVSKINKWVWTVSDKAGNDVFTIAFPENREEYLQEYYIGYCFDAIGPCGTVLGTTSLYNWIRAIPLSVDLSENALIFSASIVRPVGAKRKKNALFVKRQEQIMPVINVTWGDGDEETDNILVSDDGTAMIKDKVVYPDKGEDTPITTLVVNGRSIATRTIHIVPSATSRVRVLTRSDISIGKVTEL